MPKPTVFITKQQALDANSRSNDAIVDRLGDELSSYSLSDSVGSSSSQTPSTASGIYDKLRDGLMWGRWSPGEKLKPQHLRESMNATPAALREALIRLAGEGFVEFEAQRGFSTIKPTRKSFYEILHLRFLVESEAARLSIENADIQWEADLVAAHQRLAQLEKSVGHEQNIRRFIRIWSTFDWAFHRTLIANCGSDLLIETHKTSYDRYRLHAVGELETLGFRGETTVEEHEAILSAALDRDAEACAKAINAHLRIYRREEYSAPESN